MNYKYCKRCNKIYVFNGSAFCRECIDELDHIVVEVRDFISEHPGINVVRISDELNIAEKDILYLIKEKRIELSGSDYSGVGGFCAKCGKPVVMDKYCRECKEQITRTMQGASNKIKEKINANSNRNSGVMNAIHRDRK